MIISIKIIKKINKFNTNYYLNKFIYDTKRLLIIISNFSRNDKLYANFIIYLQ